MYNYYNNLIIIKNLYSVVIMNIQLKKKIMKLLQIFEIKNYTLQEIQQLKLNKRIMIQIILKLILIIIINN